jgi:hypothetical protein
MPHCSAASGVRAHALQVDALGDRAPGQHGAQARCAHLGGLLDHVVEARALERREQVVDVGPLLLGPRPVAHDEGRAALARLVQPRAPFAVAAVEDEHGILRFQAQDVAQVVGLRRRAGDVGALGEAGIDEQALGGEVVAAHGRPSPNPDR